MQKAKLKWWDCLITIGVIIVAIGLFSWKANLIFGGCFLTFIGSVVHTDQAKKGGQDG